jgi:hypothetical protein
VPPRKTEFRSCRFDGVTAAFYARTWGPGANTCLYSNVGFLGLAIVFAAECFAKGLRKNKFRILGARIWVSFVRSGGGKTGGIASSFEAKS